MLRSQEERNQLFMENQGLIGFVMEKKLAGYWKNKDNHCNYSPEDVEQVVALGLLKACEKYDPIQYADRKFSTYAVLFMEGEWKHWVREKSTSIRFSRCIKEHHTKIGKESSFDKTVEEIAKDTNLTIEEVKCAIDFRNNMTVFSTDKTVGKSDGNDSGDKETKTLADFRFTVDDHTTFDVESFMDKLNERERYIVDCLLQDQTQGEIAKVLGISQVQVGRIIKQKIAFKAQAHFQLETV